MKEKEKPTTDETFQQVELSTKMCQVTEKDLTSRLGKPAPSCTFCQTASHNQKGRNVQTELTRAADRVESQTACSAAV